MGKVICGLISCLVLLNYLPLNNASYVAAVIEYSSTDEQTPTLTIEKNVVNYISTIQAAADKRAQLVVFPEYGLTDFQQEPANYSIVLPPLYTTDFSNTHDTLIVLSNSAITHSVYLVVNLLEKANDTLNNTFYYNTNVVFAKNGTLIAKYRKINLYQEPKLTPGKESVTFTTDFGVFGLMTSTDILYYHPAQTLLNGTGVTDVIYPSAWSSNLPFYMSTEEQVGYALSNKVNLLAANLNDPTKGQGGTGIYLSDGTILTQILTDKPATSEAIAKVELATSDFVFSGFDVFPGVPHQELQNYKTFRDFNTNAYIYKSIDLTKENLTETVCHKTLCCTFHINTYKNETNTSEIYRLVAYKGRAMIHSKNVDIQQCSLVACLNQDTSSCGERPSSPYTTKFRKISVTSNITTTDDEAFFRPLSLKGNLITIYNVTYSETVNAAKHALSFSTTKVSDNVILFGLYGKGGGAILHISALFVGVLALIRALF